MRGIAAGLLAAFVSAGGLAHGQTIVQDIGTTQVSQLGAESPLGQSFTATTTGVITALGVRSLNAVTATLRIYDGPVGSGTSGVIGTPGYTQAGVALAAAGGQGAAFGFTNIPLATPYPIVAGQSYTFQLTATNPFSLAGRFGNPYAGGDFISNYANVPFAGLDAAFQVFELAPAVTTYTAPSATGTGNITASFTGGGAGCTYGVSQYVAVSAVPAPPPPGVTFPHGLFDFTTTGCTAGSTITMTITYPQPLPPARYYKYGPTPTDPAPHWYVLPATIAGNTATFSITDGGLGDDDLVANGTIVDQGGPGLGGGGAPVPASSGWMLAALASLMLLMVPRARRRRR